MDVSKKQTVIAVDTLYGTRDIIQVTDGSWWIRPMADGPTPAVGDVVSFWTMPYVYMAQLDKDPQGSKSFAALPSDWREQVAARAA